MIRNLHEGKIQEILEYIFMILTILQCNSIFLYQVGHNKLIINLLWQTLLVISVTYLVLDHKYININISKFFLFCLIFSSIICIYFILEFIIYPSFSKSYILRMLIDPIFIIYYFYVHSNNYHNFNSLFYKFENIIICLSILSIISWIFAENNIPTNTSILVSNWYKANSVTPISSYFHLGFVVDIHAKLLGISILRNSGIFTEASMFSYVLSIALFVELFLKHENKVFNWKTILLFITIVSTVSTTGIVIDTLAIVYKELTSNKRFKAYKLSLIIFIPIILLFLRYVISNKVNNNSSSDINSSYYIRSDDIRAGITTWKNHILFGNGLGNLTAVKNHISSWRFLVGRTGISAGLTTVLACGGILLFLFYILPVIYSCFLPSILLKGFAVFSILLLIFVATEDTYLCLIILYYLWSYVISFKNLNESVNLRYGDNS